MKDNTANEKSRGFKRRSFSSISSNFMGGVRDSTPSPPPVTQYIRGNENKKNDIGFIKENNDFINKDLTPADFFISRRFNTLTQTLNFAKPKAKMLIVDCLRRSKSVESFTDEVICSKKLNPHNVLFDSKDSSGNSSFAFKKGGRFQKLSKASQSNLAEFIPDDIVTINVSGMRYQTLNSTLQRFPETLLGNPLKRQKYWNFTTHEYFLDRHRTSEGYNKPSDEIMPARNWQRKIWQLMEYPDSSIWARILACISVSVIIISIVSFCLETIPELRPDNDTHREWSSPFFFIEFICCLWFSVELILRFISSPNKIRFMKSFLNILDFVAVAPFFLNLIWISEDKNSSISFSVLRIIRLVRVFRIFKLSRHSVGLQVLGKTFKASVQEFCLLIFFMVIALVLFSSGVYFAEQNEPGTRLNFYKNVIYFNTGIFLATMTTVGYGDLVPTGVYGKIVANFKHFYRQEVKLAQMFTHNKEKNSYENQPITRSIETKNELP